jgi:hypothetical protein
MLTMKVTDLNPDDQSAITTSSRSMVKGNDGYYELDWATGASSLYDNGYECIYSTKHPGFTPCF